MRVARLNQRRKLVKCRLFVLNLNYTYSQMTQHVLVFIYILKVICWVFSLHLASS